MEHAEISVIRHLGKASLKNDPCLRISLSVELAAT